MKSNLTDWCFQNLSKRALNALTVQASTSELGKLFQIFTMRAEKNAFGGIFLGKFAVKWILKIPPHLVYVDILPCKILLSENKRLAINYIIVQLYIGLYRLHRVDRDFVGITRHSLMRWVELSNNLPWRRCGCPLGRLADEVFLSFCWVFLFFIGLLRPIPSHSFTNRMFVRTTASSSLLLTLQQR